VAHGARLVSAATALKLLPLLIFVVVGAVFVKGANFVQPAAPGIAGWAGDDSRCIRLHGDGDIVVRERRSVRPNWTIPRALGIAMLATTLLYVAIQTVRRACSGRARGLGRAAGGRDGADQSRAQIHHGRRRRMSMFGYLGSDILGSPRLLFALARDGLLPPVLGRLHPRTHAPHVAIGSTQPSASSSP